MKIEAISGHKRRISADLGDSGKGVFLGKEPPTVRLGGHGHRSHGHYSTTEATCIFSSHSVVWFYLRAQVAPQYFSRETIYVTQIPGHFQRNKPKVLSVDEWHYPKINYSSPHTLLRISSRKLWYIYTMEYYSAIKKNTFESVLMRWMKLEPIIQSEVSQKEKHQYNILMHIYGI